MWQKPRGECLSDHRVPPASSEGTAVPGEPAREVSRVRGGPCLASEEFLWNSHPGVFRLTFDLDYKSYLLFV